ncbi:MAG: hypothetical protein ACXVP0_09940 [Bacteroidia bacterium]
MEHPEIVRLSKSDIKKIKYFVFFASIILLSQIFQFINARRTNNKFNTILAAENRFIIAMNTISLNSSTIHRSLLTLAISDDPKEIEVMNKQIHQAERNTNETINALEKNSSFLPGDSIVFGQLRGAGKLYSENSLSFLELLKTKNKQAIDSFRVTVLRSSLESYLHLQNDVIQRITNHYVTESENISQSTTKTGWILLLAGNAVLLLVLVFLIYLLFTPNAD